MTSPAFDPGAVYIRLRRRQGRVVDAELRSARPNAAAILRGRRADEAARLLPLLYSVCGAAQGLAARLAIAAARGEAREPAVDAAALAEAQREHMWRLLLDWPLALGLKREEALLAEGRRRLQDGSFADWAAQALTAPCARVTTTLVDLPQPDMDGVWLPPLDAADTLALRSRLDEAFAAAPAYRGEPACTGAFARHPEVSALEPLTARVAARAADLVAPRGLGRASAACVAAGVGRAAVETARGLLLHEVALDGDVVADYTIVAPTEWNFHPEGPLKRMLGELEAANAEKLKAAAARAVLAFDPCVRWEIAVEEGG